ncbi:Aste57867_12711 [Aphanomyces stellatus]|uniref:Aste57867_12711 protein n=1 Tax=Aphanomyces stellatus TaxID=120398 RepID=A0A485KWA1_9STRA|nr:hypothetical protein As57867_012663 [Aphanomyces stellatus]VFT89561.1 Aste57867_12711 [Aphanomyces stellatus]
MFVHWSVIVHGLAGNFSIKSGLSREWHVLCFGSTMEYAIGKMGPLETKEMIIKRHDVCTLVDQLGTGRSIAAHDDLAPLLPDQLVKTLRCRQPPHVDASALSSHVTPRYLMRATDGTLHLTVPFQARPIVLGFLVFFDIAVVAMMYFVLVVPSHVVRQTKHDQQQNSRATTVLFVVGFALYGIEEFVVSSTTWSYTWRVLCLGATKHYDIKAMGPLQITTTSKRPSHEALSRQLFGFQYGGTMVNMGYYLNQSEVETFLVRYCHTCQGL